MNKAQVAIAILAGVDIICATVIQVADGPAALFWVLTIFGLFVQLSLLSMVVADGRAK